MVLGMRTVNTAHFCSYLLVFFLVHHNGLLTVLLIMIERGKKEFFHP